MKTKRRSRKEIKAYLSLLSFDEFVELYNVYADYGYVPMLLDMATLDEFLKVDYTPTEIAKMTEETENFSPYDDYFWFKSDKELGSFSPSVFTDECRELTINGVNAYDAVAKYIYENDDELESEDLRYFLDHKNCWYEDDRQFITII